NVDVRIQRIGIEERGSMRLINDFAPEQIGVDSRNQIVALQTVAVVQRIVFEALGRVALLVQPGVRLCQPRLAPVGELAVEFVLAKLYGEVGTKGEVFS